MAQSVVDAKANVKLGPDDLRLRDARPLRRLPHFLHPASRRCRSRRLPEQKIWRRFLPDVDVQRRHVDRLARRRAGSVPALLDVLQEVARGPLQQQQQTAGSLKKST